MTAQECSQLLLSKNNILIITHTNPDGDTLCSAAALCSASSFTSHSSSV